MREKAVKFTVSEKAGLKESIPHTRTCIVIGSLLLVSEGWERNEELLSGSIFLHQALM